MIRQIIVSLNNKNMAKKNIRERRAKAKAEAKKKWRAKSDIERKLCARRKRKFVMRSTMVNEDLTSQIFRMDDIGSKTHVYLKEEQIFSNPKVKKIWNKNQPVAGFVSRYMNGLPLVIDELKHVFGLPKIGRMRCILKGNNVLITRQNTHCENGICQIIEPQRIDEYQANEIVEQVRRAYLFRYVMCLPMEETSLIVRKNKKGSPIVYSDDESRTVNCFCPFPRAIIEKWFNNNLTIFRDTARSMFGGSNSLNVQFQLRDIIKDIDASFFCYDAPIAKRINHLLSGYDPKNDVTFFTTKLEEPKIIVGKVTPKPTIEYQPRSRESASYIQIPMPPMPRKDITWMTTLIATAETYNQKRISGYTFR